MVRCDRWDCSFCERFWEKGHKRGRKNHRDSIMEVLRSTFLEKLPEVKSAIDNAAYIAIDTELTGKAVQHEWSDPRCIHSRLGL